MSLNEYDDVFEIMQDKVTTHPFKQKKSYISATEIGSDDFLISLLN